MVDILAQALHQWTPMTYYAVTCVVHTLVIVVGFKLLQVDPEHNSFIGAFVAAAIIAATGYFLSMQGLMGTLMTGGVAFGILVAVTAGDALKALVVTALCIASYGLMGSFITNRTTLTVEQIGGLTQVVIRGELDSEPLQSEEDLYDHVDRKVEDDFDDFE